MRENVFDPSMGTDPWEIYVPGTGFDIFPYFEVRCVQADVTECSTQNRHVFINIDENRLDTIAVGANIHNFIAGQYNLTEQVNNLRPVFKHATRHVYLYSAKDAFSTDGSGMDHWYINTVVNWPGGLSDFMYINN